MVGSSALTAFGLLLYLQNRSAPGTSQFFDPVTPVVAATAPVIGAVIVSRRPADPVGWLLSTTCLVAVAFSAEQYAVYALVTDPGSLPGGSWMAWLGSWLWMVGTLPLTTLLLLLFPTGTLPSPRWRPVAAVVAAIITLAAGSAALSPDGGGSASSENPLGIEALPDLSSLTVVLTGACSLLLGPICLAGLVMRYCRSSAKGRAQLRVFLAAAVLAVATPFAGIFAPPILHQALGALGLLGLAAGIVFGTVKHDLYDVGRREMDLLTSRAMVYGSLAAASAIISWLTVRLLDVGLDIRRGLAPPGVALLAVAVAWRPLRSLINRVVEHLHSQLRAYQALISLGHCLESSMVPDDVLPALAATIAAALGLPYVAVEVGRDDEITAAAVHGEPGEDMVVVPLVHRDEVVGRLTVAPRPQEPLRSSDLRLLRDLVSQAGSAAYSVRLTAELRRSKERLVTAREEEWRHLRGDLHDRLGPLDGTLLGVAAASNTLARGDIPGTTALLLRLKSELRSEITDIRALIDRHRPRSLDELGLVGALQRQATLSALPPQPVLVAVEAGYLGVLPAAVEVGAFQIASEALTNVRRHARARHCTIRLALNDGWLELEIADDGIGLPPHFSEGIGLGCMRERVLELGGSFSIEPGPQAGTRICVELPVAHP